MLGLRDIFLKLGRSLSKEVESHYFIDSGYIALGRNYESNLRRARLYNENESRQDMLELTYAHTLLIGVVGSMLEENHGKMVPESNDSISRRFALTAAFMQGLPLVEQAILQGQYVQAGALVRQEFDILTGLAELHAGERKDGATPNAKFAPWKSRRHAAELAALAHASDHKILDTLIGYDTSWGDGAATVPQYEKINGSRMYARHIAYVLQFVHELQSLYEDMYCYKCTDREMTIIDTVFSILVKQGIFKDKESSSD